MLWRGQAPDTFSFSNTTATDCILHIYKIISAFLFDLEFAGFVGSVWFGLYWFGLVWFFPMISEWTDFRNQSSHLYVLANFLQE